MIPDEPAEGYSFEWHKDEPASIPSTTDPENTYLDLHCFLRLIGKERDRNSQPWRYYLVHFLRLDTYACYSMLFIT